MYPLLTLYQRKNFIYKTIYKTIGNIDLSYKTNEK